MSSQVLITIAIIGFFGQILAQVVSSYLTQRAARHAQEAAHSAELANLKAAEDASKAQTAAADAARKLVESSRSTEDRLRDLKSIGQATHIIVNSQRTVMLRLVASMASRIAADNPNDKEAQVTAMGASEEAEKAETAAALTTA